MRTGPFRACIQSSLWQYLPALGLALALGLGLAPAPHRTAPHRTAPHRTRADASRPRCSPATLPFAAFRRRRSCRGPRWAETRHLPPPSRRTTGQAGAWIAGELSVEGLHDGLPVAAPSAAREHRTVQSKQQARAKRPRAAKRAGEPSPCLPCRSRAGAPTPASRSEAKRRRHEAPQAPSAAGSKHRRHQAPQAPSTADSKHRRQDESPPTSELTVRMPPCKETP